MVSFADIQNAYNKMYVELRKYVWDFPTVAAIADVEIATYKTMQDLADLRVKYNRLRSMVVDVILEDEDLDKRMNAFGYLINEDSVYAKINQVEEVVQI